MISLILLVRHCPPINGFRDILEEHAYRITDSWHISDLVPFIPTEEQTKIKGEIAGRDVLVISDGTTRLEELGYGCCASFCER